TPFRERDDDQPSDGRSETGPLKYAPKRPRMPKADPDRELGSLKAVPTSETTESQDPPWLRKDRPGAFVGDLDIVELRNRLARSDHIPEPPLPDRRGWMPTAMRWFTVVVVVTAASVTAGVIGYRSTVTPTLSMQQSTYSTAKVVDVMAPEPPAPAASPQAPRR